MRRCSFCRRKESQVGKLVAGPRAYICDTCAQLAVRIMETTPTNPVAPVKRSLCRRLVEWFTPPMRMTGT